MSTIDATAQRARLIATIKFRGISALSGATPVFGNNGTKGLVRGGNGVIVCGTKTTPVAAIVPVVFTVNHVVVI